MSRHFRFLQIQLRVAGARPLSTPWAALDAIFARYVMGQGQRGEHEHEGDLIHALFTRAQGVEETQILLAATRE